MKWNWTCGCCSRNSRTEVVLWAERLSRMMWICLSPGAQGDDFLEKSDELAAGVAGGGFAVNPSGGGVQRGIQGQRSVAVVLESMALGAPRGKRQNRIQPIQRLNGRLFIHAEHGRVLRRIQIQADDIGGFGLEVRIVAGHVAFQPMRLQAGFFPDPMYGVFADAQSRRPACGNSSASIHR